eukprot:scaffold329030_cov796-Tisochrysis_lutea.AAC.2
MVLNLSVVGLMLYNAPSIILRLLLRHNQTLTANVERWLRAGILEDGVFVETLAEFPQGGGNYVSVRSTKSKKPIMVRYADDFILLCKTYESALESLRLAEEFLATRSLKFKETTAPEVVHITQ